MKVVTAKEMARIESLAYKEGASEEIFMENAGKAVADKVIKFLKEKGFKYVVVLCGKGNNAGDAYVCARYLLQEDFGVVAIQVPPIESCSPLCQQNYKRFLEEGGEVIDYESNSDFIFPPRSVIVDGLFGTGFKGKTKKPYSILIEKANQSKLPIISIDIPSGLNGSTGEVGGEVIKATKTIFLGLPKLGFFLNEGWNVIGDLVYADFGLEEKFIKKAKKNFFLLADLFVKTFLPPIKRNRHKYEAGLVVGLAGSSGMGGAAALASFAALCSGAGMCRMLCEKDAFNETGFFPYEVVKKLYAFEDSSFVIDTLNEGKAAFVGPGIGRTEKVKALLKEVLKNIEVPCVIDGDALTLIAQNDLEIPKGAVLTPHMGELIRLLKIEKDHRLDPTLLQMCQIYAEKKQVTLVLKGGPTFVFHPNEPIYICPRGDAGMATAGSGDVLTGMIAAFLAQGKTPLQAASLGVYLHGASGEEAAKEKTSYCMTASDLIKCFPKAFKGLMESS